MKRRNQAGFNLVELMVVVSIIGILSAVAVPRFQTFKARAQQTEARSGLNGLYLSMQAYQANYNDFPDIDAKDPTVAADAPIGFSLSGNKPKYGYRITSVPASQAWAGTATSITALANGKTDSMRTNANNWLCTMYDSISQKAATAATSKSAAVVTDCPQAGTGSESAAISPAISGAGYDSIQ